MVVLLHGIPGSGEAWRAVAADLATDHCVLVPDLLGFADSPRPSSIDQLWVHAQADALLVALRAAGVERAVFAGHDYGGPIALALAGDAAAPDLVSGLCLAATNVFTDTPIPLPIRAVRWPLVGGVAERLLFCGPSLRMMLRQGSSRPLDPAIHVGDAEQRRAIRTIFVHALRELEDRYAFAEPVLRALDVPVLVAWGDEDPFFGLDQADRTVTAARHGRLSVYPGAGHFLPEERPAELAADLRRLTRECAP